MQIGLLKILSIIVLIAVVDSNIHAQKISYFTFQTGINLTKLNGFIGSDIVYSDRQNDSGYRPGFYTGFRWNLSLSNSMHIFTGLNMSLHVWGTDIDKRYYELNNHWMVYSSIPIGLTFSPAKLNGKAGIGVSFSGRIRTLENGSKEDGIQIYSPSVLPPTRNSAVTGFGDVFTWYQISPALSIEFTFSHALTHFSTGVPSFGPNIEHKMNYFALGINYRINK